MSKEQDEIYERILVANLTRAVDFVKFAETKNAALLTFCSAWSVAIVTLILQSRTQPLPFDLSVTMRIALILLVVAAVIAIASFLPRIKLSAFNRTPERKLNLLFFGDIAQLSIDELRAKTAERYRPDQEGELSDHYMSDLTEQLAVNSQIANRKFKQFRWGASLCLIAVAQMVVVPIGHRLIAAF